MTSHTRPLRAPVDATFDQDGVILHHPHTGSRHRLNTVASHIWELCDGRRAPSDIADAVATRFGIPSTVASRDVASVLAAFSDAGLIVTSGAGEPEHRLLMTAVSVALGNHSGPLERSAAVDWNALVELALDHGVMPLLWRAIADHWRDQVPLIVRERLEQLYAANENAAATSLTELLSVLEELERHGVSPLPLKGVTLARWLYGSAAMRQGGDLDIFVPAAHAPIARRILTARGYQFHSPRGTDVIAVRQIGGTDVCIDLQWVLARRVFRFPLTLDTVRHRMVWREIDGRSIRQPRPDDYLMILCAHASKHCWSSLIWIADIAAFLHVCRQEVDWPQVLRDAALTGGARQLLLGMRLARDVLGATLPPCVSERLRFAGPLDSLAAQVRETLFMPVAQRSFQGALGMTDGGIFYMRTRERLRDRIPYMGYLLNRLLVVLAERGRPNHHDRAVVTLPTWLAPLYYVVRPIRLMLERAGMKPRTATRRAPLPLQGHSHPARRTAPTD